MANKNYYKKIFVVAAALFILFAPVGFVLKFNFALAQATNAPATNLFNTPGANAANALGAGNTAPLPTAQTTPVVSPAVIGNSSLAAAQNNQPNFFTSPIEGPIYFVAYGVDSIMSLAVMGTAALVRLGLQFNDNIFNSPAVQTGFSVSLAIANLGFVLGIIIIALATILRNQTYGIKQLLWKLVFMAILVNFGLVITAPIVGFAGSMTNYFINATSPGSATGGYEGYVSTMAGAFAPQAVGSGVTGSGCSGATGGLAGICNTSQQTGTSADSFMKSFLALIFGIAFLALTAFTFLCIAILLVIRYLMLGGLLIVLPLAWLTWVFPKFDNSYSKWWNTFIKWTFFPPLALFFIYLAFITAGSTTSGNQQAYLKQTAGIPAGAQTGVEGALAGQTGLGGPIQQAADEVLLVGLTIMGLMFANSLTGKVGKATVGAVAGGSKAFGTWAGKTGRRAGYNAASRVARGRTPLIGPAASPIAAQRQNVARWLSNRAARKELATPGTGVLGKTAGLAGAVWGGAKNGSGLFKKGGVKDWNCQNCNSHVERSIKKPTRSCPNCGATAAVANWTAVS
jgi:hypothetical protein